MISATPPALLMRDSSRSCSAVAFPLPALHSIAMKRPKQQAMMSGIPERPKPLLGGKKWYTLYCFSTLVTDALTLLSGVFAIR